MVSCLYRCRSAISEWGREFMLKDNCLLEMLLSDEYLMEMVGCLEHDPELMVRCDRQSYALLHLHWR